MAGLMSQSRWILLNPNRRPVLRSSSQASRPAAPVMERFSQSPRTALRVMKALRRQSVRCFKPSALYSSALTRMNKRSSNNSPGSPGATVNRTLLGSCHIAKSHAWQDTEDTSTEVHCPQSHAGPNWACVNRLRSSSRNSLTNWDEYRRSNNSWP